MVNAFRGLEKGVSFEPSTMPRFDTWSRRLDAVLDDGTSVHVVGIDDLRALKARVGRSKDVDDIAQLDAIARSMALPRIWRKAKTTAMAIYR